MSHGRFTHLTLVAPRTGVPRATVLLLSDLHGFDASARELAARLARAGALVTGIDLKEAEASFAHDGDDCAFVDGDLENLGHFIEAYRHLPGYNPPWIVGVGAGATLAYAVLAQAPAHTFAGALTVGFCPQMSWRVPLCEGSGIHTVPLPGRRGLEVKPVAALHDPWVSVEASPARCPSEAFIAGVRGAARVVLPPGTQPAPTRLAAIGAAFASLDAHASAARVPPAPAALGDLPVIEVPGGAAVAASPPGTSALATDAFAVLLSGDGGWAGLDKGVAEALAATGMTVIGLDSLRYFWGARTPEGLAADLDRLIRHYLASLHKQRVLLIGYSQGANVLPFALNRMPPLTRERVALVALLGLSAHALFEFHVTSWLSDDDSGPSTAAEVGRMSGVPVLCIYGADETDSPCPHLDPQRVTALKLAGGHHFDGDYADLALTILARGAPAPDTGHP